MAYDKKTWVNRSSEHPTRRVLTPVSGAENTYDVTRSEGTVTTEGDAFNAVNMNDLEDRIEDGFNSIDVSHLTDVEFTVTEDASGNTLSTPIVFKIVGA